MIAQDFIIDLFCRVADQMKNAPNHCQAALWPSEVVTIGLLGVSDAYDVELIQAVCAGRKRKDQQ